MLMAVAAVVLRVLAAGDCGDEYCVNKTFSDCGENCSGYSCGCSMTETVLGGAPYPTNCDDAAAAPANEKCKMLPLENWQVAPGHDPSQIEYNTDFYRCDGECSCDFGDHCSDQHSGPTYDWVESCYQEGCGA